MIRKSFLSGFLSVLSLCGALAHPVSVASPDGRLKLTVDIEQGLATYAVYYEDRQMVAPSRLGLTSNVGDFSQGLTLVGDVEQSAVDQSYDLTRTKTSHSEYHANRLDVTLRNPAGHDLKVTFLVSAHDVAFRYTLCGRQGQDVPQCAVVTSEATSFRLPEGTTAFLSSQSDPMIGWARTKPSYEEVYAADVQLTHRSQYGHGYVFPALFHTPEGWVLVSETGVTGNYCGSHLSDYDAASGYTIAFPMAGENNGVGTTTAGISLPGTTPWRTITVGTSLQPIVETTVMFDVVEPLYEPSQDYRPGRYTWSWLIWQDDSMNWDDQVQFIDLAGAMGYEYCLVDAWWDTNIGRDRMKQLADYARQKGVGLLLWYNSNGYENDAHQGPRHCLNTAAARNKEMAWMRDAGIKGIKVDFFGGDKQQTMQLYEDILADANRYGLQVIFHGCTLPRGWERLFPNYVASEAVQASENVFFDEGAARRQPYDLTLHPFCRNTVASMDWGGVIMNRMMSRDNKSRHRRYTTDVFEMASGITIQSSVLCVAVQPNNLLPEAQGGVPQVELDYLRQLPSTWEETRYVDGYPGKYVVLARRHGNRWYVGGLNAEAAAKQLTLQLPMLAGQTVSYYTDGADGYARLRQVKVSKKGEVKVVMQPNGGMVLMN